MEPVVLASRTGVRLELVLAEHPHAEAGLPAWEARLTGDGLDVAMLCPEANWEPVSLHDFFSALDADWRGWDGERTWRSEERELHLVARHDKTNTVLVRVTLEDESRWRCEAELELDPGAFRAAATATRRAK